MNSFRKLGIESEVLVLGWTAVMLTYDRPRVIDVRTDKSD